MHSDYVQYVYISLCKVHMRTHMGVCVWVCAGAGLWRLARAAAVVETYFNS